MSDEMREKVARTIGYHLAAQVSGNRQPHMSGDPRNRLLPHVRRVFDDCCNEAAGAILALIASELERVERERDEALRMWPDGKLPTEYTCLTGDGWVLAGDRQSIDRVIRQDHEARAYWPATVERLKAAEARATAAETERDQWKADAAEEHLARKAAEARLAEAVEVMRPFMGLARAVTDEGSPGFREWVREAKDWTVAFSFAGQLVRLGELRALALARAFMEQQG